MTVPGAGAAAEAEAARGEAAALLRLNGVTMRWRGQPAPVLDAIELALAPGTVTAVLGGNGAGKTTLLRVVAGLLSPEAGTIELRGLDPRRDRRAYARAVGLLSAGNAGLYARLDVDQNLDLWARLALLAPSARRVAIECALERFELHPLRGRRVDRLSMGQRQRLRLALTFLPDPPLVLLDEPSTSLDAQGNACVGRALERLCRAGGAAIVCAPERPDLRIAIDRELALVHGGLEVPAWTA